MADSNYRQCTKCGKFNYDLIENIYGEKLCEDCWDHYINSEHGKAEYFVSFCREYKTLPELMAAEDSDFIGACFYAFKVDINFFDTNLVLEIIQSPIYKALSAN